MFINQIGGSASYEDTGWITTRFIAGAGSDHSEMTLPGWTCGDKTNSHSHEIAPSYYGNDGGAVWLMYHDVSGLLGTKTWYKEDTRWVDATYKTQYRVRDITITYSYHRWIKGAWSAWSETEYSPDGENQDVESKTQYRYMITS